MAGLTEAERKAFIENRPIIELATNNDKEELDMTKDNLRLFVERWREHPDSPYTVESYYTLPRNLSYDQDEMLSMRAHSPSPCDSLRSSSTQSIIDTNKDNSGHLLSLPNLNLSLERRASEGTVIQKRRDPASQIALAEEIIKLSEHLRSIAMRSETVKENKTNVTEMQQVSDKPSIDIESARNTCTNNVRVSSYHIDNDKETNEITEKLSSITRQRKLNGTTFHSSRSYDNYIETDPGRVFVPCRKTSLGDGEMSKRRKGGKYSFEQTTISEQVETEFNDKTISERTFEASASVNQENQEMDLTPPWRQSRVKRCFGETSRDVPRISSLRDLHKSLNLNLSESGGTKDLLLHLISEWDEAEVQTPSRTPSRKSISLDWCTGESIARKTMSSLAQYFQSKQQEGKPSDITSSTSPSIHR